MKHFLCLMGQLCPLSNLNITRLTAMVAVLTLFMCLTAAFKAPAQTGAAANTEGPQPLIVGDRVPDDVLGYYFEGSTDEVRISDFRGKAVILDFWATWCGSCIATFPKLQELQRTYPKHLQILLVNILYRDSEEKIRDFLHQRVQDSLAITLPVVIGNKQSSELFRPKVLPHVVWIGGDGRIKAITNSNEVKAENIERLMAGLPLYPNEKGELRHDD